MIRKFLSFIKVQVQKYVYKQGWAVWLEDFSSSSKHKWRYILMKLETFMYLLWMFISPKLQKQFMQYVCWSMFM